MTNNIPDSEKKIILEAKYYNGIKPVGKKCKVHLYQHGLEIEIIDEDTPIRFWDLNKLKVELSDSQNEMILKYGDHHPFEYLEFSGSDWIEEFNYYYKGNSFLHKKNQSLKSIGISGILLAAIVFIGLLILGYLYALPFFSHQLVKTIPMNLEKQLGDGSITQFLSSEKVDSAKSKTLNQFFQELNFKSNYSFTLYYVNSETINAFAVPGGHIVVYDGIVSKMNSYTELAGLLGHEFTHIEHRHTLKTLLQTLSSYLLVSLIFGDVSGVAAVIIENANSIRNLSYSRNFEKEADMNGLVLMEERNINPQGMVSLFEILDSKSDSAQLQIPAFLSTHPITEDRIKDLKEKMKLNKREVLDHPNLREYFEILKTSK